jgi:hypothetical protein
MSPQQHYRERLKNYFTAKVIKKSIVINRDLINRIQESEFRSQESGGASAVDWFPSIKEPVLQPGLPA